MTNSHVEILGCTSRKELEEVVDLCDAAFPKTEKEYFVRHVLKDKTLEPSDTRVLVKDRKILSSVQVFPRTMYVKGKKLTFGGIGNVATLPAQRGKGYAGMVMQDALNYIKSKKLRIALLSTTINSYYEKFGFTTIMRHCVSIDLPGMQKHPEVRAFDQYRDLNAVMGLYEKYNNKGTGPVVRDSKYWHSQLDFCGEDKDFFFIYDDGGEILGFIRAKRKTDRVQVLEYAFADHRRNIIQSLFEHLAFAAHLPKLEFFTSDRERGYLPFEDSSSFHDGSDMMVNLLDDGMSHTVKETLLGDYQLTFWLTDFF
jgi:predicted N-acetyltransferase YhbS